MRALIPRILVFLHLVCPLLFFTHLTRNPYATQIYLLSAGLSACLVLIAAASLRRGSFFWHPALLDGALLAFAAVALASWALSWRAHASFRQPIWHEGLKGNSFLWVNALAAYFLASQPWDDGRRKAFCRAFMAAGALAAAYGVMQYLGHEFIWPGNLNPYNGRPVSTFGNPNFLSSYLVMLLPISAVSYLRARTWGLRSAHFLVFLVFTAAVLSTLTRSSWLGALAGLAVLAAGSRGLIRDNKKEAFALLAAVCALIILWPKSPLSAAPVSPFGRMEELLRGIAGKEPYGSWHQRLMIWSCAWDMARERPLFGVGYGCFELFFPLYQGRYLSDAVFGGFRTHANNAHNLVLEILSQTGLAGLGVFLWMALTVVAAMRKSWPALSADNRLTALSLFAGIIGMAADNFFGNVSLFFAVPAFLFFWLLGTLMRMVSPLRPVELRGFALYAAALPMIALAGASMARSARLWRAEVLFFDGYNKIHAGDVAGGIESLEKSRRWNRYEVNNAYELANAYARQYKQAKDFNLPMESDRLARSALAGYDDALDSNSGYDEIHLNKANVLRVLGRTEEAVLHYRMALLINPFSEAAAQSLADAYLSRGEASRSRETYERAVSYLPSSPRLWNNLGVLRMRMGSLEDARRAFLSAITLDPHYPEPRRNLELLEKAARPG